MLYLCIVFFMVLDLRLTMKIVVVVRQPFFFNTHSNLIYNCIPHTINAYVKRNC